MPSVIKINIRGYHIDAFGHVNHARYIRFMEAARWDYLDKHKAVMDALKTNGIAHATVHISINYHHPAVLGDVLRIETAISRKSRRSITFRQQMFIDESDRLAADAEVVNVFFTGTSGEIVETERPLFSVWDELSGAPLVERH